MPCNGKFWQKESDLKREALYEIQYFDSGFEAEESGKAWERCKKNPGHVNFIPFKDFTMDRLPEHLRHQEMFDAIQNQARLTVRVRSNYGSPDRLVHWPTPVGFRSTVGSGYVTHIKDVNFGKKCDCSKEDDCASSEVEQAAASAQGQKRWLIEIVTAAHVLYTNKEAQHTHVDFFYDDDEQANAEKVSLKVSHIKDVKPKDDYCLFHCVSDDEEFINKLRHIWVKQNINHQAITESIKCKKIKDQNDVVIVSHPHGQPKQIAIGSRVILPDFCLEHNIPNVEQLGYTSPTCPGSSGAGIWCSNQEQWLGSLWRVHSMGIPGAANASSFHLSLFDRK